MKRMQVLKCIERALKAAPAEPAPDVDQAIWNFFVENKPPYKDVLVHSLAAQLGMDPDEIEERIYNMFGSLVGGGRSQGKDPGGIPPEILKVGMDIEAEHSDNPMIQKKIVWDHVAEMGPEYYVELPKMEKKLGG